MKRRMVSVVIMTLLLGLMTIKVVSAYDANAIVNYLNSRVGASYANGYCLGFIDESFQQTYGYREYSCCAYRCGSTYLDSSSRDIPLGACVFFGGSSVTCRTCGSKAGHIGVYVGDGYIVHAWSGKIVKTTIDYVINCGYPYRGWGWLCNNALNSVTDTSAPTISNIYASNVSGSSFTVNCDLYDDTGVTRVWLNVYGPGGSKGYEVSASNGGFSHTIYTSEYGGKGLYSVHIYAFDAMGNEARGELSNINAANDTEAPVVCSLTASNISSDSFTINCDVYDNIAVTRAYIIVYGPGGNSGNGFSISVFNNFSYTINTADYGGRGLYNVHVYIFDDNGNKGSSAINQINAVTDAEVPVIHVVRPTNVTSDSFTIDCEVSDNVAVTSAYIIVYGPGGNSGNGFSISVLNNFNYTVKTSDYGGTGWYSVHVYVFDDDGNKTGSGAENFYVGDDSTAPQIMDVSVTNISDSSFDINCTANEKIVRAWFNIYGPNENGGFPIHIFGDNFSHTINTSDYGGSGEYTVHVYVWDPSGNESAGVSTGKFIAEKRYTINFDADEGSVSVTNKEVIYNYTYGELPIATKDGYTFKGWYTAPEGGTQITADTQVTITEDQTLYAQWEKAVPYIKASAEKDGTEYIVTADLHNNTSDCAVVAAGYSSGKLADLQKAEYTGTTATFTLTGEIDEIKIMVWDSLSGMQPICEAAVIPSSEFIS